MRKAQQPTYIQDDDKLVRCLVAGELCEFVQIRQVPMWGELKKQCQIAADGSVVEKTTGLVLDGVRAEARPDKFEVKINA